VLLGERIVEVRCQATKGYGSGYLVGTGLILTACHVIADLEDRLPATLMAEVRSLKAEAEHPWQPAKLVWPDPGQWSSLSRIDIALLSVTDGGDLRDVDVNSPSTSLGWGRLPIHLQMEVTAVGFPRFKHDGPTNTRDTHQIFGLVAPLSAYKSDQLEIQYSGRKPNQDEDWKGLSGSAVFSCNDETRILGVLVVKVREKDNTMFDFKAIRLEAALKHPDFINHLHGTSPKRKKKLQRSQLAIFGCTRNPHHVFWAGELPVDSRCPIDGSPIVANFDGSISVIGSAGEISTGASTSSTAAPSIEVLVGHSSIGKPAVSGADINALLKTFLADKAASDKEKIALQAEVTHLRQSGEFKDQAIANFLADLGEEPGTPDQYPYRLGLIVGRHRELLTKAQRQLPEDFERGRQAAAPLIRKGLFNDATAAIKKALQRSPHGIRQTKYASSSKGVTLSVNFDKKELYAGTIEIRIKNARRTTLNNIQIYVTSIFGYISFNGANSAIVVSYTLRPRGVFTVNAKATLTSAYAGLTDEITIVAEYYDETERYDREILTTNCEVNIP
jgi:hypothetical protein